MSTTKTFVAIGLGSNLGARQAQLAAAVRALGSILDGIAVGGLYESRPVGAADQPLYLNTALTGLTHLPPEPLLASLKFLEQRAGRVRGTRWGPRPLDLDLLLHGEKILATPALTLPHPRLRQRPFVLAPLADIAPRVEVPPDGAVVADLLAALGAPDLERLDWSEPLQPSAAEGPGGCYPPARP